MLAKRLTQRGVVFSGGSVAAVLSAGSASASAPPALVASTIKAASLLAAGQAAGVVTAKVAALTEGVMKAMFVTKIKSVMAVVLVFGLVLGGIGLNVGLSTNSVGVAQQPGNKEKSKGDEKKAEKEESKTDGKASKQERKVLTPEEAIKQMPKEDVTVQFKVASVQAMPNMLLGFGGPDYYIFLNDGGKFTARLARAAGQFMADRYFKLGIKPGIVISEEKVEEVHKLPVKHFSGKVVRVTGRVEPDSGNSFQMWVHDITLIEVVKE
jgi:hypothetical protein